MENTELLTGYEDDPRPLLLLKGVYEAVIDNSNYVIFGENQCIRDKHGNRIYDIGFHVANVPHNALRQTTSLVIPVLVAQNDDIQSKLAVYELNKTHPWINLFGIKYLDNGSKHSSEESLAFWEILDAKHKGEAVCKKITDIGANWRIVTEQELMDMAEDKEDMHGFFNGRRLLINNAYSPLS